MADAVSSGSCPILFKVLTLSVAICIVCLHFGNFCCLSSVADFSNTETRALTSAGHAHFLPVRRAMRFGYGVWVWVMVIFQRLFLFSFTEANLIEEQQEFTDGTNRSCPMSRRVNTPRTRLGIALSRQKVYLLAFTSTTLLPMDSVNIFLGGGGRGYRCLKGVWFPLSFNVCFFSCSLKYFFYIS